MTFKILISPRTHLKWMLYPGVNLHARLRYRRLPAFFGEANGSARRKVFDAGCGNGMLSYQSYLKGNDVFGISIKDDEVEACRFMLNRYQHINKDLLNFDKANLYNIELEAESFDEIICTEVLEHLRDDAAVCRKFWRALKPGGFLHITAPNAAHPYNRDFPLDPCEQGGHVRPGYTLQSYRELLEPIGFEIRDVVGLGGPVRQAFNRRIKEVQERFGPTAGLPLFFISLPCLAFENKEKEREQPYSIYLRASKPVK